MKGWVLILGATSAIARATASTLAAAGYHLCLAGRDIDELERDATNLAIRFGNQTCHREFDVDRLETHGAFFSEVQSLPGGIDGVVVAVGYLGDSPSSRNQPQLQRVLLTNFVGPAAILALCADYLEARRTGFIVGISSVAGDRGRQSNYVYGAAKGGFSIYLQGLRNRLFASGVTVVDVKPGFVDTPMTYGLPGMFLVASPAYVGERIVRAVLARRDVVYVPWFWRYIMLIIRHIPEKLFKRLKL